MRAGRPSVEASTEMIKAIAREAVIEHVARDPSALGQYVARLQPWLEDPTVTEFCINRPREAFVERPSGWRQELVPFATELWCQQFARLVAGATRQRVNAESPLLSAALPTGERVQVVLPPAVPGGTVAITIRRPSGRTWGLEELARGGAFDRCVRSDTGARCAARGGCRSIHTCAT